MINIKTYHVEILTPKQNTETLEEDLAKFAGKYSKIMETGYAVCITDNPMGMLSFQATEIIPELGLTVDPERLMIHLTTFHTKPALDEILGKAAELKAKYLLVVSGDGSERMPRLKGQALGLDVETVTSVELLQYINKTYPGRFTCGVAFNQYEPQDHELEKMRRKIKAGAKFIVTQPVLGRDTRVLALKQFKLPVIILAWMSRKLDLISECVGYEIHEENAYDPLENLKELHRQYPDYGYYLSMLGYKKQLPLLKEI